MMDRVLFMHSVSTTVGTLAFGLLGLFGVTESSTPVTIVGAFIMAFVTVTGLVAWIVRKLFDTTIPEQQKMFKEQMEKTQTAYSDQMKELRQQFAQIIANQEQSFRQQLIIEREFFNSSLRDMLGSFRVTHEQMLARIDSQGQTLLIFGKNIESNQMAISQVIKFSETMLAEQRQIAQEWRDVEADNRKRLKERYAEADQKKPS